LLNTANGPKPVFLISITQESLRKTLHTYAVPVLTTAGDAQVSKVSSDLLSGANTTSVSRERSTSLAPLLLITAP
jgi:hypothetical protein